MNGMKNQRDRGYLYTCPSCEESSSSLEWNHVTVSEFSKFGSTAIMPIDLCPKDQEDLEYICPRCYEQSPRKELKKGFSSHD